MSHERELQETREGSTSEGSENEDNHPIAETWIGFLLLWSAFIVPPFSAPLFAITGIGSFPPVRRWVASAAGDVPHVLEVGVAVVYLLAIPVALGAVWWSAFQDPTQPTIGDATIIAVLMLGIMGVIAVIVVYLGRGIRSLT